MSILFEEVFPILYQYVLPYQYELINITNAKHRVLKSPILSPIPHPPFNKSAMDGWAYYASSLEENITLNIHPRTIATGNTFNGDISENECIRIMTGAKIPDNCNAVHRFEYSQVIDTHQVKFTQKESSRNIIKQGQNLAQGDELLPKKILNSKDITVLSSSGITEIEVAKMPRIGIISTGDEVKLPNETCTEAQIFESNGAYLTSVCSDLGFENEFLGIVSDNEEKLTQIIKNSIDRFDILIFSGAVSQGDFDLIPKVLDKIGVHRHIHGVKVKPGKPFYFGTIQNKAIFGLPGNPISTFVCFEVFIKPYLYKCMNYYYKIKTFNLPLAESFKRKDATRKEFIPAKLIQDPTGIAVKILPYKGSTMITILPKTEVLTYIDIDVLEIKKGELIHVRFL